VSININRKVKDYKKQNIMNIGKTHVILGMEFIGWVLDWPWFTWHDLKTETFFFPGDTCAVLSTGRGQKTS
jgi:hypothetical protein